jgi:hypothetical protein
MGKKHRCKACERERLESRERELVESWLCLFFFDDVFCPYSKVSKENRMSSKCLGCVHFERFEREMEEEEVEDADFVDAVERDPEAYLRGDI